MNINSVDSVPEDINSDDKLHGVRFSKISYLDIIIILSISTVIISSVYYLYNPATLPIRQVRIEGEFSQLSTSRLQTLVKDKVRGGFFNIDVTEVREAVLTEPWVHHVSVHRVWPDSLRVSVNEQVAIASWKNESLLNENGELFNPDMGSLPDSLPLLEGPVGTAKVLLDKYKQINKLLLIQLQLNERRSWTFILNNNLRVIIGRSDFDDRIIKFIQFVPTLLKTRLPQIEEIDMRYTNGFAVRWIDGKQDIKEESGA